EDDAGGEEVEKVQDIVRDFPNMFASDLAFKTFKGFKSKYIKGYAPKLVEKMKAKGYSKEEVTAAKGRIMKALDFIEKNFSECSLFVAIHGTEAAMDGAVMIEVYFDENQQMTPYYLFLRDACFVEKF
ncbi:unnamed protein product, partial [Symbiodinium sp. KB8]